MTHSQTNKNLICKQILLYLLSKSLNLSMIAVILIKLNSFMIMAST
jgi:hypothetical protein